MKEEARLALIDEGAAWTSERVEQLVGHGQMNVSTGAALRAEGRLLEWEAPSGRPLVPQGPSVGMVTAAAASQKGSPTPWGSASA